MQVNMLEAKNTLSRLVAAADAGLYDAKRRGRNAGVEHDALALAAAS